jgi:hypothetical protein
MLAYLFLALALAVRFLPHAWHFTPLGAALLFFGSRQPKKQIWIAVAVAAIADVLLTLYVYHLPLGWELVASTSYYVIALAIGTFLRENADLVKVTGASLAGSIVFFLISNFATWVAYDMYPHTISGLATCYLMAIPFFRNTLIGDVAFALAMFGTPMLIEALQRKRALVPVER